MVYLVRLVNGVFSVLVNGVSGMLVAAYNNCSLTMVILILNKKIVDA